MDMRKLMSLVLAIVMTVGMLPAQAFAAEATSGTCGENAYWSLDTETGLFTVSGTGAMDNYYDDTDQPWYHLRDRITQVVVEEGITSLGNNAFRGCTALESAVLPESLTAIEYYAFALCSSLDAVIIHSSKLTTMGSFLDGSGAYVVFTGDMPATLTGLTNRTFFYPADNATWTAEALASCSYSKGVYAYTSGEIFWTLEGSRLLLLGVGEVIGHASVISAPWYGQHQQITEVKILKGITKLNQVFTGMENLKRIRFAYDAVSFSHDAFAGLDVDVLYPIDNTTWNESVCQSYGGNVDWAPYRILPGENYYSCAYMKDTVLYVYGVEFDGYDSVYNWSEYDEVYITEIVAENVEEFNWSDRGDVTKVTVDLGVRGLNLHSFDALQELDLTRAWELETMSVRSCPGLETLTVPHTVKEIDVGFNHNLKTVTFIGDAPVFSEYAFANMETWVYYPDNNGTWTEEVMQQYGGSITWVPVTEKIYHPLEMGDNGVHIAPGSIGFFSFTAEEAGTYVMHLPWDSYYWSIMLLDAEGNRSGTNSYSVNGRYGLAFDLAAGETVYLGFHNENEDELSCNKTLTVALSEPLDRINYPNDCISGTVGGSMETWINYENILNLGAKYIAVSDDESVVKVRTDGPTLYLDFVGLGSCNVTISSTHFTGETVSKTITVKSKEDQTMVYGEHTLTMMHGETEYYLFTPTESGYYVIYFPDLTEQQWNVNVDQYGYWTNEYYNAAGCVGYRFWLDADVQTMIHVDNYAGQTDTQRFVFAKATDATGIRLSQTEITGKAEDYVQLTAQILPETYAEGAGLYWESSNVNVVGINYTWDSGHAADIRLCGPGTATVRVYNDELGIEAFVTVTVEAENPLTLGENSLWIPADGGETLAYFMPEVSGEYVLVYEQSGAHIQSVYGVDGTYPTQYNSGYVDGVYVLAAMLEAGMVYRYHAFAYSDVQLSFTLQLADETTGISLPWTEASGLVGDTMMIRAYLEPITAGMDDLTWTSSDESVFTVEPADGDPMYANLFFVGSGDAILTVRTENGQEASIPVHSTMPPQLELGENEVTVDPWYVQTFAFTAPADGTYILSWPSEQGWPDVWPDSYEAVNWADLYEYGYFAYSMTMTAGQTCFLYVNNSSSWECSWTMTVAPAQAAESVSIVSPRGNTGYVGTAITLYADVHPGAAATDGLTWKLSNDNIGTVVPTGDYQASVYLVTGGFADVIVTTDSGLSATYRIHSEIPKPWLLDETKEVTLDPDKQIVYSFTPSEDGWYVLYYGEEHVSYDLTVVDSNGDQPSFSIHGSGNQQAHRMLLTGGETYYLALYHDAVYEDTAVRHMTLAKATAAESVTVTPDQGIYAVGDYGYVSLEQNPITAVDPMADIVSSDPDVVYILGVYSDGFDFNCNGVGTATVTLIYESGYTVSLDITVTEYESLEEGDNSLFIPIGEEKTYLFTPSQTGLYGLTTWYNPWWTTVTTANGESVERTDYVRYYQYETRRGYLFELEEGVTYQVTVWNNYHGDTARDWQWFELLPEVPAAYIELNTYNITLEQGGTGYLAAYIDPANAYTAEVTWIVGDESVATIDEYGDVRGVGAGTTTITAVSGDVSATCTVTVNPAETVGEGSYWVSLQDWGGSKSFRFVPEESGNYVFALDGTGWGMMMLFVYENGVDVTADLVYYRTAANIGRSLDLTAGKEYILSFVNQNEYFYEGMVHICRSEPISEVEFEMESVTGYVGKSEEIHPSIRPFFAANEVLSVESSDPSVVSVENMYQHGICLNYLSVGTATVTVTAANGSTDTLTVHVTEIPTLTLGELTDIHMEHLEKAYYRFTVETEGVYVLVRPDEEHYFELRNVDTYDHPFYSENWGGDYYFNIYVLEPGTYELYLEAHNELDGQLGIGPRVASKTLDISETEVTLRKDGQWKSLFAILDSPFAIGQTVEWTCADENIVRVTSQDVGGVRATLTAVNVGQTTVTATLGDISVTCTVTVEAIPELTEGQTVTVTSDEVDQLHYFTFTPATTGVYTFMASRSDVMVDQIETYTCSTSGRLLMYLERNQTYTVTYRIMNQGTGTFDVAVKAGNYCGMNATWTLEDGVLTITGTGDLFDYEDVDLASASPWINYQGEITEVVISDGITSIGDLSFMDLSLVKTLTVPASVTRFGAAVFRGCYALETIVFEGNAPTFAENALEDCHYINMVYPAGNATWTGDVKQDYCGNDIKWSDGAYLSYRYLQNEGSGYFNLEYRMFVFTAMDTTPGDNNAVIFYTNIWDGQTWTVTPVDVQGNEFVILEKIMDVAPGEIASGASKAEYFYFLNVTEDSWNQPAAVSVTLDDGRVLTVPISVGLPEHGFYSAPEITPENYITYFEWDPDSTEDRVFYYGYNQKGDQVLVDVATQDMEGWLMSGHEYVILEALENGMYKITVSQDAPDGFWLELFITLRNAEGHENYYGYGIDCHAGQSRKPYLAMYDLNWSEEGWYLAGEERSTDSFNQTPGSQRMVLFTINYLDENGEWVEEPVEIRWTDGLTVTKLQDLEDEPIAPGAEYGQYYYKIEVNGWNQEETLFYELNGQTVAVGVNSYLPRFALYSEPAVSSEYFIYDYQWDPNSDESRDFYFGMSGNEVVSFALSLTDPAGNPMPGTEHVTLTRLDNGMYKITVSADVEDAFLLEMWLTEVYADGSVGEGSFGTLCYPAEDYRCGENAFWSFDEETGTLTVSGIGAIDVGAFAGESMIRHLVIEEGITGIGMSAFEGCTELETLSLPGSLQEIGTAAFKDCVSLTEAQLPEGLSTLSTGAFEGCTGLTDVTLPESLRVIWGNVFAGCTSLTEITIPAGVESMFWSVFANCTALREITFEGSAPNNLLDETAYPVLDGVTATVYYPGDDLTWTEEVMQSYGGNITWVAVGSLNGWVSENGSWYYYVDNVKQTGWLKINGYWYYMDSNGIMQTGWVYVGNKWYYFSAGGAMQTGWVYVGSSWYYFSSGGAMQTGWVYVGSSWYYFASGGAMQTGWVSIGGKWYYFASGGAMQTGWVGDGGKWYYMASSGAMQTGWITVNGFRYYLDSKGVMQTGWIQLDGTWYYLTSTGAMATGWTYDGSYWYYMDGNGMMQRGWITVNGKWYYLNKSGVMQTGWLKDGGYWYYLDATGAMVTGTQVIGGKTYVFNKSGVWIG